MHTALLSSVSHRLGIVVAREMDPWLFPEEGWVREMVEECTEKGCKWEVEQLEREYRSTEVGEGGVKGWVRLMGKQWLDAVEREKGFEEREMVVREVVETVTTVVGRKGMGSGRDLLGYVRLRGVLRKVV